MDMKSLFRFGDQRGNYWSCSPFANWIRRRFAGYEQPLALGLGEWRAWKKQNREAHPFVYWLTEDGLPFIQNLLNYPFDIIGRLRNYFINRFVDKKHVLDTKLPKGQWHEFDTRMLHGLFEALVDFVEVEKAHMHMWTLEDKSQLPLTYRHRWLRLFRWGRFRSKEFGLAYINWEMSIEDCPWQAEAAKEQLELYNWWKDVRPNRPDPYDVSGWTKLCEDRREANDGELFAEDRTDEEKEATGKSLEALHNIEEQYEAEDEAMMIRLIKIRRQLWT